MHVYKTQYANSVKFFAHNNINVTFLIINLVVDIVKNIVNNFIIVQIILKCDYEPYSKNNY